MTDSTDGDYIEEGGRTGVAWIEWYNAPYGIGSCITVMANGPMEGRAFLGNHHCGTMEAELLPSNWMLT
jgi:hypothetical protein